MNPRLRKFLVALASAVCAFLFADVDVLQLGFNRLELAWLDYRFQARGSRSSIADSSKIVIVEISDKSFTSLSPQWPWPRSYYAKLLRNLKSAGAKVVGIDIILSGPDPYSPTNDEDLHAAIRETGIVVLAGKMDEPSPHYQVKREQENFGNLFFAVDSSLGLVNIRNDADGVFRRYAPYWESRYNRATGHADVQRIPTFGFAVLNKYFNMPPRATAENNANEFLFAGRRIPKYDQSSLLINLYGPSGTFRRVNFADVLDDETITTTDEASSGQEINTFSDPEYGYKYDGTFKDKIVLVGSTIPEHHDLFPVAFAQRQEQGTNLMYGVEIHAHVIESVLRGEFLTRSPIWADLLLIVMCSFLTFYGTSALRGSRWLRHFILEFFLFVLIVLEMWAVVALSVKAFVQYSIVLATIGPLTGIFVSYAASAVYHFVNERKRRLMIRSMFSTYVNPKVVDELILHPEKLKLGGERKELTVLFSDIEGFTTIAENLPSEGLVSLLNEYFGEMTTLILQNDGTLDKFFGDAIVAFWGAPLPQHDHALRACLSALAMQRRLAEMRERWHNDRKPRLHVRIGINTGEMVVGNLGGTKKFDYTVIGDGVNIASRLEGANRVYRTGIMASETTYERVKHKIVGRELDLIAVKGRREPLRTFELLQTLDGALDPTLERFLQLYHAALRLYRGRQWDGAIAMFGAALELRPHDYPTRLHLERAEYFKRNPPPEEWDGVVELTMK